MTERGGLSAPFWCFQLSPPDQLLGHDVSVVPSEERFFGDPWLFHLSRDKLAIPNILEK